MNPREILLATVKAVNNNYDALMQGSWLSLSKETLSELNKTIELLCKNLNLLPSQADKEVLKNQAAFLLASYLNNYLIQGDALSSFIKLFNELEKNAVVEKNYVLKQLAKNSKLLFDYLFSSEPHERFFKVNYKIYEKHPLSLDNIYLFLRQIIDIIKDDEEAKSIQPLFKREATVEIEDPHSYGTSSSYETFRFVPMVDVLMLRGFIAKNNYLEFLEIFFELIQKGCLDDEDLYELSHYRTEIVSAAFKKIENARSAATSASAEFSEQNIEFELALASQDPTRGLGRYLLLANGYKEPTASKNPLSDLGKLLAKEPYLQKILEAIRADRFNADQLKGLAFLKNDLLRYIESLDLQLRIQLFVEILNKKTSLGDLFHLERNPVPNPSGPSTVMHVYTRLQDNLAEVVTKLKLGTLSSSFLERLGSLRKEIIAHIVSTSADFWSDYLAAIQPGGYLNMYLMANNKFELVTPSSLLMQEMNAALCARPELLLSKLYVAPVVAATAATLEASSSNAGEHAWVADWKITRSATFLDKLPEECYPALTGGPAALISYFKTLSDTARLQELLSQALNAETPLGKFFALHSKGLFAHSFVADLKTLQAESQKPRMPARATVPSGLFGGAVPVPTSTVNGEPGKNSVYDPKL